MSACPEVPPIGTPVVAVEIAGEEEESTQIVPTGTEVG